MISLRKNRFFNFILVVSFLFLNIFPFLSTPNKAEAAEFGMLTDFLIQTGISFYDQGRYTDAMNEFKKALVIDPRSTVAKEFLMQIQKELYGKEAAAEEIEEVSKVIAIEKALNNAESQRQILEGLQPEIQEELLLQKRQKDESIKEPSSLSYIEQQPKKAVTPVKTILISQELKPGQENIPLEMERGDSVLIKGDNIKRFLNVNPERIEILRQDQDTLLITANDSGKSVFHIWDNNGRSTFEFKGTPKKFFGAIDEEYREKGLPIGLSEPFKLSYAFDWGSFHTGRRFDDTERQSLTFGQSLSLRGETPYGRYDSSVAIQRLNKQYEYNNLTMGLTDAHLGKLEHLNIRLFDFGSGISGYKFPNADLRGASISAPMFNGKLHYGTFWGGLPEGNYTRLEPGLGKTKDAYLEGVGLGYNLSDNAKYRFYYAHAYGPEINQPVLTDKAFGFGNFYKIGNLNFDSEVAYDDADHISYTTSSKLSFSRMAFTLGFTEEDRDFVSPLGGNPTGGSTTGRFGVSLSPTDDISISNNFTATRNSNLFNPEDVKRPNYKFTTEANWRLDPFTSLNLGYDRDDTKGTVSPGINQTKKLGIMKEIFFIKKVNTFFNYSNLISKYLTGSTSNYDKNTLGGGLGFNVLGDLYYSVNKNFNFTENRITGEDATSHVLENSLSYYSRILESPFYGSFRVSFRDEEEAESSMSYLSGEDRLEFSSELDYRPNPYIDGYVGLRVANVWAETDGATKHLDAEVRYGLRLAWDTGFRWNTKGHVHGFVFNDLNGDSIKSKDEEGIVDVLINAATKKSGTTNENGFYSIKGIIGKEARVGIDIGTIPRGYTLTTPSFYDIKIEHGATKRLDFGITSRSEIVGVIFVDVDGNDKFDRDDESLSGVIMVLDGTEESVTDAGGQYLFRNLSPGEHTISIDLKTLSSQYIPNVSVRKKIVLEEGATFFYNIPLRTSSAK